MAEEKQTPEEGTPEVHQPSAVEQRAMEQGWVPQEEWTGDPDDWRPAKEFVDRGELFRKIDELKNENKRIRQGVEEFKRHHEKVKELAYKQALADLKAQKKLALESGDADAVIQIDEKIAETREEATKAAQAPVEQPQPQGPHPDFVRWEARNTWYKADRAMKAVADEVARDMVSRGEQDITRILTEVDKEMRKAFPTKFENPRRNAPGAVEAGTNKGGRATKEDYTLTEDERRIMNRVVATGAITKEKYIEQLKAISKARGA